ncbi:MAG: hypothetical protein GKR88_08740 [Flavobacteriaceae bacterium]|nr:MAG: hypothetical protein GKR88_08720 [Flavobacteriaceae bacterium]QMU64365.1 MAG: hypothetical protein GKR88_08740 [Flavobacteriaceae bacterium]
MKKTVIILAVNLGVFILLRIINILIAFVFFGIGSSASSEEYTPYILIPSLILHLFLILFLYLKKKFIQEKKSFVLQLVFVLILFYLGSIGAIPF